jgi:hypothetical protein
LDKLLPYLEKFLEWLLEIRNWNSPEGWVARFAVWLVLVYFGLLLLKHILELLLALKSAGANLGIPFNISPEKRAETRRRRQFCNALISDLSVISKSENWNDQFFTDLEAQIEAEGRFYATRLDKLMRRESAGLRRVRSLIKAIESSAEQFLLLIGDPGSGKSVALRHLAFQYARKAMLSNSGQVEIPLYINLKELSPAPQGGPTAEFIKEFVLDHIRRGDSDTAAYIKEHWDKYRGEGVWFFLFDSFDEIPAVLHAPSGSDVISKHSNAIRQFLAGMSGCRGVVASREFKGPDALPWQKFRILPMSMRRKRELVDNYFLPPTLRTVVLKQLDLTENTLYANPLFLTLLCRHVKEEKAPPVSDLGLLDKHLDRLAERDSDFLLRRYSMAPRELIDGATLLARLFAEDPHLSLAPTQDDISAALSRADVAYGHLDRLLPALVYVKIGRSDVQEARAGDQRFTFAHRRYQEALFVRFLAQNTGYLSSRELLTDIRWREYAVTLLQTQSQEAIDALLVDAAALLIEFSESSRKISVSEDLKVDLSYFDWTGDPSFHLLSLLQEALVTRLEDVPTNLRQACKTLLWPRWCEGDLYDKQRVLSVCGLLPVPDLIDVLETSIQLGSEEMLKVAFRQCAYLPMAPSTLVSWLDRRLSDEIIVAKTRGDLAKLEAFAAKLPVNAGAGYVWRRSCLLRKLSLTHMVPSAVGKIIFPDEAEEHMMFFMQFWLITMGIVFTFIWGEDLKRIMVCALIACIALVALYASLFRDVGAPLGRVAIKAMTESFKHSRSIKNIWRMIRQGGLILGGLGVVVLFVIDLRWMVGSFSLPHYVNAFLAGLSGVAIIAAAKRFKYKRKSMAIMDDICANESCRATLAFHAEGSMQLSFWYERAPEKVFIDLSAARSYSRLSLGSVTPVLRCGHSIPKSSGAPLHYQAQEVRVMSNAIKRFEDAGALGSNSDATASRIAR